MPASALKSMAKKAHKSLKSAEAIYAEAKRQARRQGFHEGDDDFYAYVMGITKRRLGLETGGYLDAARDKYEVPLYELAASKPKNKTLWSKAKAAAKRKFKVYPSWVANQWASSWYKKHGGTWETAGAELAEKEKKPAKAKAEKKEPEQSKTANVPKNYNRYFAESPKSMQIKDTNGFKTKIQFGDIVGLQRVKLNDYLLRIQGDKSIYHIDAPTYRALLSSGPNKEPFLSHYSNQTKEKVLAEIEGEKQRKARAKEVTPLNPFDVRSGRSYEFDGNIGPAEVKKRKKEFIEFTSAQFDAANKAVQEDRPVRQCLKAYKDDAFVDINEFLRFGKSTRRSRVPKTYKNFKDKPIPLGIDNKNDKGEKAVYTIKEAVEHLDRAFDMFSTPEPMVVGRFIKGTPKLIKSLEVGSVIHDKGYVSTSTSKDAMMSFMADASFDKKNSIILNIGLPKGTKAIPMAAEAWPPPKENFSTTNECEMLLPRDQKFKITNVRTQDTRFGPVTLVEAELVHE